MTSMYAGNANMMFYGSGVINSCPDDQNYRFKTDHTIILVGFRLNEDKGIYIFKGKNSWGLGWGMNGYFWIQANNACNTCVNSFIYI